MKKGRVGFILLSVVVLAALVVSCGGGSPQQQAAARPAPAPQQDIAPHEISLYDHVTPDYVIRMGVSDPIEDLAFGMEYTQGVIFKNVTEALTAGKVQVEVYPSFQLGPMMQQIEAVQAGDQHMMTGTGGMPQFYPPWQAFSIPFLFKNDHVAVEVMSHSDIAREMYEDFRQQTGMRILGMSQNGFRHFTNNQRPIRTPADLEGLRFRVMAGPVYQRVVEALGASAIPIDWSELYTALQTGVVDGQENAVSAVKMGSFDEVQKYITLNGHLWAENFIIINDDFYNSLPEQYQQVLKLAGFMAEITGTASEIMASYHDGVQYALNRGMEIYAPTSDELNQFRDKAQEPVVRWLRSQIGDYWVDGFLQAAADAEAKYGY